MVKKWIIGVGTALGSACLALGCAFAFGSPNKATAEGEVPAYYVTSDESTVRYGAFDLFPEVEGLATTLKSGDKLVLREVVDLKALDQTDTLLQAMVVPSAVGVLDATSLNIRIVDAFDETNFVNVNVKPNKPTDDIVYALANASNGQMPSGVDRGGTKLHVGTYGSWVHSSFTGTPKPSFGVDGNIFGVSFNNQTNSVYVYEKIKNEAVFIADLDDDVSFPRKAWKGFTTGEVYFELEFDGYNGSMANVLVTSAYAGIDSATVEDTQGPIISVDTLGYENALPTAVIGEKYDLFEASAYDAYSGECTVERKVYTNYYSDGKGLIPSHDFFIPQVPDTHYIVYTATDGQNNTSTLVLTVDVLGEAEDMYFAYGAYQSACMVGELYDLPTYTINGGSGEKDVSITVENGGEKLAIEYGQVRPMASGTMEITYVARDYLGMEHEEVIRVNVTQTDKASFIDRPILPRAFIDGNTYRLPVVQAYNFVNGNGAKIDTVIKVTEKGATRALDGNTYVPSVQNSGEKVTVSYEATIDGKETAYAQDVPVYKVYDEGSLKMEEYFLTEMTKTTTFDDVRFTTSKDATIDFINPTTALGFSTGFYVERTSKISKVNIYLEDYADKNNVVKFTYETKNGVTTFFVNDSKTAYPVNENILAGNLVTLTYNDNTKQAVADSVSGKKIAVETNLAGEAFEGFAQKTVYVRYELVGVTAESTFRLESVCGHYFNNETQDWIAPVVYIDGTYGGGYSINTTATLSRPFAMDVIDGDVGGTFTVKDPSGNIVTDIYGNRLENIEFFETQIELTTYGRYVVTFYTEDKAGNVTNTFAYTLRVLDEVAPELTVNGGIATKVKVGSTVALPKAVAVDNYDAKSVVQIMVIDTMGHTSLISATTSKYKLTRVGTYVFCYFTQDEAGNIAYVNQFVTVEE